MADKRILFFIKSGVSCFMAVTIKLIKAWTSASGRFQFSVEKVYIVRYFTPIVLAASTTLRTDTTPS